MKVLQSFKPKNINDIRKITNAFNLAIKNGLFSTDKRDEKWAGNYAYVGKDEYGYDRFKKYLTNEIL